MGLEWGQFNLKGDCKKRQLHIGATRYSVMVNLWGLG